MDTIELKKMTIHLKKITVYPMCKDGWLQEGDTVGINYDAEGYQGTFRMKLEVADLGGWDKILRQHSQLISIVKGIASKWALSYNFSSEDISVFHVLLDSNKYGRRKVMFITGLGEDVYSRLKTKY